MIVISRKKGFNQYKIDGDTTIIYFENRLGEIIMEGYIDTEDLPMLIELGYRWGAAYDDETDGYYAKASVYIGNGKNNKTYYLHKIILGLSSGYEKVGHHKSHDTLDNRKDNLEESTWAKNVQLRSRANKNNKSTGVRNVCYIEDENSYWVQIMKHGERFKWVFPADQFDEACEFVINKRIELFGEA